MRRAVRFCVEVLQAPQGSLASLVPTVTHILVKSFSHDPSNQVTGTHLESGAWKVPDAVDASESVLLALAVDLCFYFEVSLQISVWHQRQKQPTKILSSLSFNLPSAGGRKACGTIGKPEHEYLHQIN